MNFPKRIIFLLSKFRSVKFRSDEYKDRKLYAFLLPQDYSRMFLNPRQSSTLDFSLWIPDSRTWTREEARFQIFERFWIPWAEFSIPNSRIVDITSSIFFTTNVRKTSCYLSEQNFSMGEWLFTALKCCLYWSPVIYFLQDYQKLHSKNSLLSDAVDCLAVFVDMCSWNPQCKRSFT